MDLKINNVTHQPMVLIPENDCGIADGWQDIPALLREHKNDAQAVQFIADMIEH